MCAYTKDLDNVFVTEQLAGFYHLLDLNLSCFFLCFLPCKIIALTYLLYPKHIAAKGEGYTGTLGSLLVDHSLMAICRL